MSSNIDNCLIQIRSCLQSERLRLWEVPYYVEGFGPVDSELQSLSARLSAALNIPLQHCTAAINELQAHALDKIKSKATFQDSGNYQVNLGVATIKVRVSDKVNGSRLITVLSRLDGIAEVLYALVASKLDVPSNNIKLVGSGRMIRRNQPLYEQGIQNNQQIMAILLEPDGAQQVVKDGENFDMVQRARNDAATLLQEDDQFMDMENQEGEVVHLPPAERASIMMALSMHEKGRAALKRRGYNEALVFFLEADADYKACSSTLLETVDNYALLNLDIVWCYVMLKSIGQLPDAEYRLKACETHFKRCYGPRLDRVVILKGNALNERALIMRLHLLQAILRFHQNKRSQACDLFDATEIEWQRLQVCDNSVRALTDMGYTEREARLGLRSSANSIDSAITFILGRRENFKAARKTGRAERNVKSSLAKTKDGPWVNPRTLHSLIEMGYDSNLGAIALQKTDNDIDKALTLLQNNSVTLQEEFDRTAVVDSTSVKVLVLMGFNEAAATAELKKARNNLQKAVENLLKLVEDGTLSPPLATEIVVPPQGLSSPSTSAAAEEAYDRFAEDLQNEDDEYLDMPLLEERALLDEYKLMLKK